MIRAAIVGLGRWGRSLVTSVQGRSDDIRFVAAHTRTRASAEDFCREKNVPLVERYEQILADPDIDAVVLATPHSQHEQQVLAAAAAASTSTWRSRSRSSAPAPKPQSPPAQGRRGAGGRLLPALPPFRGRGPKPSPGRPARHRHLHGGAAHDKHRQFIPADNWRAAPEEAPGGALTAVGVHSLDHMIEFAGRCATCAA